MDANKLVEFLKQWEQNALAEGEDDCAAMFAKSADWIESHPRTVEAAPVLDPSVYDETDQHRAAAPALVMPENK